jgi:hypothetical protein
MNRVACTMVLCGGALVLMLAAATSANQLDACTLVTGDEIRVALGRKDIPAAKPSATSGGHSDCRFAGSGAGDVRVTLTPATSSAKDDFDLKTQIYADEGKKFERVAGIGDGAYYWDDTVEFRVGTRIVSLWVNRTPRTESAAAVKTALLGLARRAVDRLRSAR